MDKKQFFLHKGNARIAEAAFILIGLFLFAVIGHVAMGRAQDKESVVGVQESVAQGLEANFPMTARNVLAHTEMSELSPVEVSPTSSRPGNNEDTDGTKARSRYHNRHTSRRPVQVEDRLHIDARLRGRLGSSVQN